MESEIYCPLNEWRCIVLCASGKAADWKLYAYIGRLAHEDWMTANERAEKKSTIDSNKIELPVKAVDVKPHDRAYYANDSR